MPDGREALHRLQEHPFDVVLMDVQMPGMDGFQATQRIRAWERSRQSHVPIVAMTAHALPGDRQRCLAAGMDGYLAKPVHVRDVIELVEQYSHVSVSPRPRVPASVSSPCPRVFTSASSPAAPAVFHPQVALSRLGGDRDLLGDVVEFFFEDSPELLEEIHAGLEHGDGCRVQRAAHSLKGLSANLEAPGVVEAARRLEQATQESSLASSGPLVESLEQEIFRLKEALNEYSSPAPSGRASG